MPLFQRYGDRGGLAEENGFYKGWRSGVYKGNQEWIHIHDLYDDLVRVEVSEAEVDADEPMTVREELDILGLIGEDRTEPELSLNSWEVVRLACLETSRLKALGLDAQPGLKREGSIAEIPNVMKNFDFYYAVLCDDPEKIRHLADEMYDKYAVSERRGEKAICGIYRETYEYLTKETMEMGLVTCLYEKLERLVKQIARDRENHK